jgi:pimeloyl-ACP methyl ester carboxylesterase
MRTAEVVAALTALALAGAAAGPAVAQAAPNPWWTGFENAARAVRLPDGRVLNLYCEGAGGPVVILDSGLGDDASSWRKVQDPIAATTRVCAYDRAGYGKSNPGPLPRDTKAEVEDLERLLKAARLPGPYVLVGHSMASFNVRLFAFRHPKDVAGIVLVDPSADNQMPALTAAAPATVKLQEAQIARLRDCAGPEATPQMLKGCAVPPPFDLPPALAGRGVGRPAPTTLATVLAEYDAFGDLDSKETVAARRPLGAIPLIVLTAADTTKSLGANPQEVAAAGLVWSRLHDDIATLSTRGVNRQVAGSGHYIQMQKPQVVIDAVDEVVAAARAR